MRIILNSILQKSDMRFRSGVIRYIVGLIFEGGVDSVNTVMTLRFYNMLEISILAEQLLASQVEDSFKKVVDYFCDFMLPP